MLEEDWVVIEHPSDVAAGKQNCPSRNHSFDPGLPRSNPTVSSWQIPPSPLQNHRSTESLPTGLVDVVIIGSGLSGTSVAWHLLRGETLSKTTYLSTLMLEAREVCSGATGRNGTCVMETE